MVGYKIISADSHIIEPPDMYATRIQARLRDRAPKLERRRTVEGKEYDTWVFEGVDTGGVGNFAQVGLKYHDQSQLNFYSTWENVRKAGYDPHEMIKDLDADNVWGAILQPSAGLQFYKLHDGEMVSAICWAYNSWVLDFCQPYSDRLKAIGCINVDDIDQACEDLERCAKLGFAGVFIPVSPLPERPYRDPAYERMWATAQDLDIPLLLHIGAIRSPIPGSEFEMDLNALTAAGRSTSDHWVRYSLTAMIFAGVFDRYPRLKVGSVEHEMAWVPHWLSRMDNTYLERPTHTGGFRSTEGMLPRDYWHRNMFVEFMEDDTGIRLRDIIGVDNMLWGNDFPHSESTWPKSMEFLDRVFADAPDEERWKITSGNAADLFKFQV